MMYFIKFFLIISFIIFIKCNLILVSKEKQCENVTSNQWTMFNWFFKNARYIKVVVIYNHKNLVKNYIEKFLMEIYERYKLPVLTQTFNLYFEDGIFDYSELFSWQGEKFPLRDRQNLSQITFDNRQRSKYMQRDETNFVCLLITSNIKIIEQYLRGIARRPLHTPRGRYILACMEDINDEWLSQVDDILQRMWRNYGLMKVIAISTCQDETFWYHNPFQLRKNVTSLEPSLNSYGITQSAKFYDKSITFEWSTKGNLTFRGYPISSVMFYRNPTALPWKHLPKPFVDSYFADAKKYSTDYGGFDGIIYGNLIKALNFTPVTSQPTTTDEFGYRLENGSYTGAIADVLYSRVAMTMNARFLQQLESSEIEFLYPVYFDRFCIIAPKASKIPSWLAIFKCFDLILWCTIICFNTLLGFLWYLFKEWSLKQYLRNRIRIKSKDYYKLPRSVIDMWIMMTSGSISKLPKKTLERLFLTGCLLLSLVVGGTFQGSLRTSYSTTSYYKDIDTLEQLDKSGLFIGTSSRSLMNVFGDDRSKTLESLNRKFVIKENSVIDQAAYEKNICCIERASDIKIIIAKNFELGDGSSLLHVVKECPRSYYLGFIVRKGWPFLDRFNQILMRFSEAGLMNEWYEGIESAIILNSRLNRKFQFQLTGAHSLQVQDIQTPFLILFIGVLIATISFLIEILFGSKY